jgi:pentatricopeptide repeat protein
VTDAWAKTSASDSTHEAEHLLREMIRNPRLEPSSISYNAVLDSHAHSSDPDSLERMDKIWQHMRTMADRGSTNMQPNVKTVHMILSACVRKVDRLKERDQKMACAQQALKILEDVKARGEPDMDPDVMAYSMVMDAFGKVGSIEAAWEAEYLMKELEQLYEQTGDFRKQPNVRTYTTLISAWARSKDRQAAKRAEQLLYEMKDLYDKRKEQGPSYLRNGEETTKPNVRTYTAVIQALSRSGYLDKSKRVLNLLMEMRELAKSDPECAPQVSTYNLGMYSEPDLDIPETLN